jgi:hypothetical protein
MNSNLEEMIEYMNPDALKADGFDDAIIGFAEQAGRPPVLAYDSDKCIEKLMSDGMTMEEAMEYFEFNISSAYMGENTPIFITKVND